MKGPKPTDFSLPLTKMSSIFVRYLTEKSIYHCMVHFVIPKNCSGGWSINFGLVQMVNDGKSNCLRPCTSYHNKNIKGTYEVIPDFEVINHWNDINSQK